MYAMFVICESAFFESQTNKQIENLKISLESKIASGVQQKLGLLEEQTSLSIAMEFSLRPANFSLNRTVALHTRGNLVPGYWLFGVNQS